MGQWNPSIFDNSYSAKLPRGPMRTLAGFHSTNRLYYNPRTTVIPDDDLLRATPIGRWCYDALEAVLEASTEGDNQTAIHTLRFFCELNKIFLQDAAAMMILHPDREDHPLFHELAVFGTDAFKSFKEKMKSVIQQSSDPMDANLETVLPGVHQWHSVTNDSIKENSTAINALDEKVDTLADRIDMGLSKVVDHLDNQRAQSERTLAATFINIAQDLLIRSSGGRLLGTPAATGSPVSPTNPVTTTINGQTSGAPSPEESLGLSVAGRPLSGAPPSSQGGDSNSPDMVESSSYRMVKKHTTLDDMWDEWHGTGKFADDIGGIQGRNKHFGAKWRKHLEGQQYSRTKLIVEAIAKYAEINKLSTREACAVMNAWYTSAPIALSITKMKQLCIDKGLLKKGKQRGKQ